MHILAHLFKFAKGFNTESEHAKIYFDIIKSYFIQHSSRISISVMVIVLFKVPCVIYSMTTMEKRGVLSELGQSIQLQLESQLLSNLTC